MFACLVRSVYRVGVELVALSEAQRFVGAQLPLQALSVDAFEQTLAKAYQLDSASMQLAEDIGGWLP